MKNPSSPVGRMMKALAGLKVTAGVLVLAACGSPGEVRQVTLPVNKVADPGLEVSAYFFAAPDDFEFVAEQDEPGVAGIYPREIGERLVKRLSRRRGFALSEDAPARSAAAAGELKEVREFIYPTEYAPPEVEERGDGELPWVKPATPVEFDVRELGVVLNYTTRKRRDGQIEVRLDLERTVFMGFVNYGSPITATRKGAFGREVEVTLTENRIEMPVFDRKTAKAGLLVKDGDFIAVGGFLPEVKLEGLAAEKFTAHKGPGGGGGHNFVALIQVETGE